LKNPIRAGALFKAPEWRRDVKRRKTECKKIPLHGRQFALKWEIPDEVEIDMDRAQMAYY
jgi:hypothetical protein